MTKKGVFDSCFKSIDIYKKLTGSSLGSFTETIFLPDTHFKWVDEESLTMAYFIIEALKPARVVQLGDLYDLLSFSKFPRSRVCGDVERELSDSREMASKMWSTIRRILPRADLIQIRGNHDERPFKRLLESNTPELEAFCDFKSLWMFPESSVLTILDTRKRVVFDGVEITHGHTSHGKHRMQLQNHVVHGHDHKLSLTINRVQGRLLFEMGCGFLGDASQVCFNYTPKAITNWDLGVGYLCSMGPIVIPF